MTKGSELEEAKSELIAALQEGVKAGASDVHIISGEPFSFRIGPDIRRAENTPLSLQQVGYYLESIAGQENCAKFQKEQELDLSFEDPSIPDARFRVNAALARSESGTSPYVTFRIIPKTIRPLESIGFPNDYIAQDILQLNQGLVLVTGVTGSGKSTTLASLVQRINETEASRIISIEDPIEYVFKGDKSLITQREVGTHTKSFARAVKWSLRQDPDILLIGEIRDAETAREALKAAETGHLVFSTLHTKDAPSTVGRITELFDYGKDEIKTSLANNLAWIISQQLVPYEVRENRFLAMEAIKNTPAISQHIRKGDFQQIRNYLDPKVGMIEMDTHLYRLYQVGSIDKDIALRYAYNRAVLEERLSAEE